MSIFANRDLGDEHAPPAERGPRDPDYQIDTEAPHWAADNLPAGDDAWTYYGNYDRWLTKRKEHERGEQVKVVEPIGMGERAKVSRAAGGGYEAKRDEP